jgi:hypothetical protein
VKGRVVVSFFWKRLHFTDSDCLFEAASSDFFAAFFPSCSERVEPSSASLYVLPHNSQDYLPAFDFLSTN